MSNVTKKIFTDTMGGTNASAYIGQQGDLFYDPATGALRVSDGESAGGTLLAGGSTGNITFDGNTISSDGSGNGYPVLVNNPTSDGGVEIDFDDTEISHAMWLNATGLTISLNSNNENDDRWRFLPDASLEFPDGTTQSIAYRDPEVTNMYFVNPLTVNDYTPTGTIIKPFRTITAAQAAIEAAITAGDITPGESNPVFIILTSNITENITLSRGHVFLIGLNSTIHAPIYLNGSITVSGSATGTGALDSNHFSIQGLAISAAAQQAAIYFTGANAQRLFVKDLWLTARGNQTGTTAFTDAGGYGIYADCTGFRASPASNSVIHGSDIKVSHTGTGDVYCFKIGAQGISATVSADFSNVETSGATQVGAVGSGCLLAFNASELDANGDVCLESYGTGVLSVANSTVSNAATGESYGIWLHTSGGAALLTNTIMDVESSNTNSRMIKGVAGTALFYKNVMIGRATTYPFAEHNKKIDSTVTAVAITTDSFTTV